MNIEYENVTNIISGKDLDYLSDMFSWSYNALLMHLIIKKKKT